MTMLKAHLDKIREADFKRRLRGHQSPQSTSQDDEQLAELMRRLLRKRSED